MESRWFPRRLDRELADFEARFVEGLSRTLEAVLPSQVDPNETTITGEGTSCLIPIVPHRSLGGLSLACWFTEANVDILWTQIGTLTRHDDLDDGLEVGTFSPDTHGPEWLDAALRCFRAQLDRPIEVDVLRVHRNPARVRAELFIEVEGENKLVGQLRRRGFFHWLLRAREEHVQTHITRFTATEDPPLAEPSGAHEWGPP